MPAPLYDQRRAVGASRHKALRVLANHLIGICHGCLRHRSVYDEHRAWHARISASA